MKSLPESRPRALTANTKQVGRQFNVSRESLDKIALYVDLLLKWQAKINLIGPIGRDDVWQRHIADSLQLAEFIKPQAGPCVLLDLGTGAGLPGIPLGLHLAANRNIEIHLVESNGKKAAFLREALRQTGLKANLHNCRIESIDSEALQPQPSHVLSRALAPLPELLELASPWLSKGAIGLFLKGQHVDRELTESAKCWSMHLEKIRSRVDPGGVILAVSDLESRP